MLIRIRRSLKIPDPVRLALYRRSPDLGPKILFFTGGTALRPACGELIQYSHNTIHIVTPFDSGGSSAKLREAFRMPAIGDVRNRLLALADRSLHGNPEIFKLFAHRFPEDGDGRELSRILDAMTKGRHPLVAAIPDPMRKIIRHHLRRFREHMPEDFDLAKASIGNLILTGGYLDNGRHMDPVIYIFSKLVQVRGTVRPLLNRHLHLIAELENGEVIVGQHRLTGKETAPIAARVSRIYLSGGRRAPRPAAVTIRDKMVKRIGEAELICYPMGSFFSSLVANLLPSGVGTAVRKNPCPKVYVPSTGHDPEVFGYTLTDQVERLVAYLRMDDPDGTAPRDVLDYVIVDRENGAYPGGVEEERLNRMGIEVIDCRLIDPETGPLIQERHFVPVLFSLV